MEIEQNIFFDEFTNKLIILENSLIGVQNSNYNYNHEEISEIFRAIHTIKGTADLLGMFSVVSLVHKSEDLLEYIREDKIRMDEEICKLFLELKNFIAAVVDNFSQGIFDDSSAESVYIAFEKEFNRYIHIAETSIDEYESVKTILVVADSAMVRYTIKKIAIDEGYNVLTSDNTEDGWQKIKDYAVDLLFCDFSEPNEDAVNLAETIRIDSTVKNMSIVMLLTNNDETTNKLGKQISAKAWLKKPVEENKVKLVLSKILEKTS